ncbi:DUF885 domain-containing protein [Novosphingobium sp. Gsoil 351]|uniref:DUF885 domain-containing protein n=1 Tax=Novosphingobium sp. Gsoil 351 TaxID=2675225 RepID=UPI0012B4A31A|nr:DUF885 domain-containing protein [Novosphingobium sp. Gsoil 351]QGN55950.1 DUF885 family protein [Novosphingobium sp. Gsoil 351]
MKLRHALPLAIAALTLIAPAAAPAKPRPVAHKVAAKAANAAFAVVSKRYIAARTRFNPTEATTLGEHRYDALLPDISARGRAAQEAEWRALLAAMNRIDRGALSRENQVDYAMLDNQLRYDLWTDNRLQAWRWDPQIYNSIASGALYGLAARDFAPWPQRLKNATARMEALPAFLAEARRQLDPARVPKVHAETVARRNPGIVDTVTDMLVPHLGEFGATDRARFEAAQARLKTAVDEHQKWLDTVLVPQAKGEFRLGPQLYDEKMKFALESSLTRADLKARATASVAAIRGQMYALSRKVLIGRTGAPPLPDQPSTTQQQAAIEAALALSYAQRPPRDGLMDKAKETLKQATDFVRAKGFVEVPDTPVQIIEMPRSSWGYAVAYDDAPGPLEKNQPNFYAIAPIPPEWSDEQATSFLSEYNDYMIHDLSIHEAMPGHYLQLAHANRFPGTLRAVLGSGPFVEGWAVYGEGLMMEHGYLDNDPLYQLTVLKMRLRSVTNTLLDIGIQTEGMTRDQAMDLMMNTAFQQEREAAGKWVRASLSSVQLLSYFTGYEEHRELRAEAERRWGKDFDLRKYNDMVLAHGSPPVKYVRALLFDMPVI